MKKQLLITSWIMTATFAVVVAFAPSAEARTQSAPSIVDIVLSNPDVDADEEGDFGILLDALLLADPSVLDRLSRNGQNTVFAPTDAAFLAAFEELEFLGIDPDDVLNDEALLTLILEYHIAPGYRDSGAVLSSETIRMRDGGFLGQDAGFLIDNLGREAKIIAVDVQACNGVVHVINNVVLPALP